MSDWTISKLIEWSEDYFRSNQIDNPRLTAEILLSFSLDIKRIDLYLQHDRPLNRDELSEYKELIKRRKNREPVAYITGEKGFYNSRFLTPPGVLIPRPDTETLVEHALKYLNETDGKENCSKKVLELGAGSGAIIVSLADLCPEHLYFANDLSGDAVTAASFNAKEILRDKRIHFFRSSWLDSIKKLPFFDMIVSNPPYIRTSDIAGLAEEIKDFEPATALDGGGDGLDCYREIILNAADYLADNGVLMLEIGYDQKEDIADVARLSSDFPPPEFEKDLAGHWRVAILRKQLKKNK